VTQPLQLLERLCRAGLDFVIVGGFAGVVHGSSTLTRDLDICAWLDESQLGKLRAALIDLNPVHRISTTPWSLFDRPAPGESINHCYLQTDLGPLDVLSSITGVGGYQRIASQALPIRLGELQLKIISLDDLITAKEALGRSKDLLVASELKALRQKLTTNPDI
jgi:hypothetical protein